MMRWIGLLALTALVAAGSPGIARAQQADAPRPSPASETGAAGQAAEAGFRSGISLLANGDYAAAATTFRAVADATANPRLRREASSLAALAEALATGAATAPGAPGTGISPPQGADKADDDAGEGRPRFVVSTTLAGIYTGVAGAIAADVDDGRAAAALTTLAGALGFGLSFAGARDITPPVADAYSLGLWSGVGSGLTLAAAANGDSTAVSLASIAGMFAYGGVSAMAAHRLNSTRGGVAHTGTLTMNLAATGVAAGIIADASEELTFGLIGAGINIGFIGGWALAPHVDFSRKRTLWIDGGSILGGLLGLGLGVAAIPDGGAQTGIPLLSMAGLWGGYAAALHLTRDFAPDPAFERSGSASAVSVVPLLGEGQRGLAIAGSF